MTIFLISVIVLMVVWYWAFVRPRIDELRQEVEGSEFRLQVERMPSYMSVLERSEEQAEIRRLREELARANKRLTASPFNPSQPFRLELRPARTFDCDGDGPWTIGVVGGPELPDVRSVTIANKPGDLRLTTVEFVGIPFHSDVENNPKPAPEPYDPLPEASSAYAALSYENKRRFMKMYGFTHEY
jgi:hypothetical protein